MLIGCIGKQGSGKTIVMVKKCKEYYDKGYKIYSNVHLNFPYEKIKYLDIINCVYENAVVFIDEIHLLLSARNSMSKVSRKIVDSFLSQIRKKHLILLWTSQTKRKIDIRLRDENDILIGCNKYIYAENGWIQCNYDSHTYDKDVPTIIRYDVLEELSGKCFSQSIFANEYYDLYDTRQIIFIDGLDEAFAKPKKEKILKKEIDDDKDDLDAIETINVDDLDDA